MRSGNYAEYARIDFGLSMWSLEWGFVHKLHNLHSRIAVFMIASLLMQMTCDETSGSRFFRLYACISPDSALSGRLRMAWSVADGNVFGSVAFSSLACATG